MRLARLALGLAFVGCRHAAPAAAPPAAVVSLALEQAPPAPPPPPPPTCLVLSVGGAKGMAHIGAIDALKAAHVPIDCVYGNSMGAVVGSLYAFDPRADLREAYRKLIADYVRATAQVKTGSAALSRLVTGLKQIAKREGGWSEVVAALTTELKEALFSDTFDHDRFERVLDGQLHGESIDALKVRFATSYQTVRGQGLDLGVITTGNAAQAVSRSANNPFIFKHTSMQYLDPGGDRVAAVPIEDACKLVPGARLIVINVAGAPSHFHPDLGCDVHEATVPVEGTPADALRGAGAAFDRAYEQGYSAAAQLVGMLAG